MVKEVKTKRLSSRMSHQLARINRSTSSSMPPVDDRFRQDAIQEKEEEVSPPTSAGNDEPGDELIIDVMNPMSLAAVSRVRSGTVGTTSYRRGGAANVAASTADARRRSTPVSQMKRDTERNESERARRVQSLDRELRGQANKTRSGSFIKVSKTGLSRII